jgi:hypothetical protein
MVESTVFPFSLAVLEMEPRASRMLGKCSTIELRPQSIGKQSCHRQKATYWMKCEDRVTNYLPTAVLPILV